MKAYSYAIIKDNNPTFQREFTLLENKYKPTAKYVLIEKITHKDGSENISRILYSNDIAKFQVLANNYVSWYNYPLNLCKNIQGFIKHINS